MRVDFTKLILSFSVAFALSHLAKADEPVLLFNGTNSYIQVGTPNALQIPSASPFTVEGWVRLSVTGATQMIYSKNIGRASPYTYMFGIRTSGTVMSAYTGQGGTPVNTWRDVTISPAIQTGRWYHVAYSYDGTIMTYYLDGIKKGTNAYSFGNTTNHTVKLGGYTNGVDITGSKSDLRVWNYARSAASIRNLMNRRLAGGDEGLVGYWPMNEGVGESVLDKSGYASDGAISNGTWITDALLSLQITGQADFVNALPFTLACLKTGSTRFTNTNEVDLAAFPIPTGCDLFQITQSGDSSAINPANWVSTNTVPDTVFFTQPPADTNVVLYAWFTNSTESVALRRGMADITFTLSAPTTAVRAAISRMRVLGLPVAILYNEVETGSTGGTTGGEAIPFTRTLYLVAGPDINATPNSSTATVSQLGVYDIKLIVMNAAGSVVTSSVCQATVSEYDNGNFVWAGTANGSWHDPLNWNYKMVPPAGVNVRVTNGTPVLAASTEDLNSFTQTGGTLTMTNWTTALRAQTVVLSGGTLTHYVQAQAASNAVAPIWVPNNRIWIVCSNFTLSTPMNISKKGFNYNPKGPNMSGFGPGGGVAEKGGGYGGFGGGNPINFGVVYGAAEDPQWPGSSGGNRDGTPPNRAGGAGGGLLVLEASGHVLLNSLINADGDNNNVNNEMFGGGGGSGGGVNIRCATLAATNGIITANGGNGASFLGGSGGGGRIALAISDSLAQTGLPVPRLVVSAQRGLLSGPATGLPFRGDYGTISVNHPRLMPVVGTNIIGIFSGSGITNWSHTALALTNSYIVFTSNKAASVSGDMMLNGTTLLGLRQTDIGGNVTLTNASTNSFYGILTNGLPDSLTTRVSVTGRIWVATNCTINVYSEPTTGGSPFFEVGSLYLAQGGLINASEAGFGGGNPKGFGPGTVSNILGGASYGGTGGRYPTHGGTTYGSAAHPAAPGSGGAGTTAGVIGRYGGGLIHMVAAQSIALHGIIKANGGAAAANIGSGSGGGIYLWTDIFEPAAGTIQADGGAGTGTGGTALGGGGGGRIARYYRVNGFAGTATAAGGAGAYPGATGTVVADYNATYMTFTVEGSPARRGVPVPNYGANGVVLGVVITNQAPGIADESGGVRYRCLGWRFSDDSGLTNSGVGTQVVTTITTNAMLMWYWTNEYSLAVSVGPNGQLQNDLSGWYTQGDTPAISPVPNLGYIFSQWSGTYQPGSFVANPLTVLMDRPRAIRANFSLIDGEAKTWSGSNGNWITAASWSPSGIPGPLDTITIGTGDVSVTEALLPISSLLVTNTGSLTVMDVPFAVFGNVTVSGASARITMTRSDLDVGGNLDLLAGADLYVNSAMTSVERPDYGTRISVTGSMSLANGSWIYPQSHNTNGGSVFFQVGDLLVSNGGGFDADFRGYRGGLSNVEGGPTYGFGPGKGYITYGGGYGGCGGSAAIPLGQAYGSMEYPNQPGSGGGGDGGNPYRSGGSGGGLVWIESKLGIRLDGAVKANGQIGQGDYNSGGGSGGGIYLRCRKFEGSGSLNANAGNGWGSNSGTGGGGGRIAVWRINHLFMGTASATNGVPFGNPSSQVGTIYWGQLKGDGTIIMIR